MPDLSPMGYTNNFGETAGVGTKEGVQTEIISYTFKKFVTKIMEQMPSLNKPENMSVSQDMRHFLSYIHNCHGNTFRKVVVSGLLLSIPTVENYKIEGKCYSRSVNGNVELNFFYSSTQKLSKYYNSKKKLHLMSQKFYPSSRKIW